MSEVVTRSITVNAGQEHAFSVFTEGFDTWWPRSHHIGKSPMKRAVIEGYVGGRCYSEQEDGTDCPWGSVTVWDPPKRFVFLWQINSLWQYESDASRSSEVEVSFTPLAGGATRVDLEHRHFERAEGGGVGGGEGGGGKMREMVSSPGGWGTILELYKQRMDA